MKVRFRGIVVTVYRKSEKYPFYRVAFHADGRRVIRSFKTLAEAKKEAEAKARALYSGNHSAAILPKSAVHAYQFALGKLGDLARDLDAAGGDASSVPVPVSLEEAITEYVEAKRAWGSRRLIEAVTGYQGTVAQVRRVKVRKAVDEYLSDRRLLTVPAGEGKRPALSPKFHYQEELRLRRLADTLDTDVADLTKEHFDLFFREHLAGLSAKSRNHYRGTLRQWIAFCVGRDFLPPGHRLLEARAMQNEKAEGGDVAVYSAEDLTSLLKHVDETMIPLIAIGAFAGLRTQELLRLEWSDVWRRPGYIEVTRGKAKTRQRRLVPISPTLQAWLAPYRDLRDGRLWTGKENYFHQLFREACEAAGIERKDNAVRHSALSYRLAEIKNEHQVASEAGTSVHMLHRHYRELVAPEDARQWFEVLPESVGRKYGPGSESTTLVE